ncbi:helix-hairpin-helix domain-containing protein [Crocinitomix catalasitica]|nr:helix-hairpin-helix domain-containing protein [Crocinitomix catalasitica]
MDANGEVGDPFKVDESKLEFFKKEQQLKEVEKREYYSRQKFAKATYKLFNFDPNKLDGPSFEELGFSPKQANSIVNFRDNYGDFNTREDFGKLFVVSEKKFEELRPYIQIKEASKSESLIEINGASADELQKIRGIGPVLSNRIIKYREMLGGFSANNQFSEIYGLDEETLRTLISETSVDARQIRKMEINSISKFDLDKHPYIDFKMKALILDERDKRKINNLDFMRGEVSDLDLEKILPYVSFE